MTETKEQFAAIVRSWIALDPSPASRDQDTRMLEAAMARPEVILAYGSGTIIYGAKAPSVARCDQIYAWSMANGAKCWDWKKPKGRRKPATFDAEVGDFMKPKPTRDCRYDHVVVAKWTDPEVAFNKGGDGMTFGLRMIDSHGCLFGKMYRFSAGGMQHQFVKIPRREIRDFGELAAAVRGGKVVGIGSRRKSA